MKNIVIINHHATIPKYEGGGRHHEFSTELTKRGFNVTLIASSYKHGKFKYLHDDYLRAEKTENKYKFISIRTSPAYRNMRGRLINYLDFTKKVVNLNFDEKPDVVVASSVHPFAWKAGYKLAKKYNAKFIVEVRDLWPLSLYEDLNSKIRPFIFYYFNRLEKKYYNLASSIIVTAPNAHKYMNQKYNINTNKIFYIPHSVDLNYFDENLSRTVPDSMNDILSKNFCISYSGSLSKSEGLENFMHIARKFKDNKNIKFVIVGSGEQKQQLNKLKDELELTNTYMFDAVTRAEVPSILSKSDVLFCGLMDRKAFRYGISKNKFYDYMAAKKPIIFMSNVDESVIEKADCGIVIKDYSIKKTERFINDLYNDKELYNRLSENGRKYVENYHKIEEITKKFLKVISD